MAELKLDDKTIANIEELREHYATNYVFECAQNGTLLQWLKDCGYDKEAEAIELLYKQNDEYWDMYDIATHIKLYQILNDTDKIPLIDNTFNKIIANLNELRDYYNFSAVLDYFKSGNLSLWLEQNGYVDESSAIKSLSKDLGDFKLDRHIYKILHNLSEIPFIVGQTHILKIDDLREHYNFSDILEYFKNGELVAWLEQNGHIDEAKAVESLSKDSPKSQHLKLYEILNGADNTPQWIREWFGIYDEWLEKYNELEPLLDKALDLYATLNVGDYQASDDECEDIESLNNKIEKLVEEIQDIERKSGGVIENRQQQCKDYLEIMGFYRLTSSLMRLATLVFTGKYMNYHSEWEKYTFKEMRKEIDDLEKNPATKDIKVKLGELKNSPR